MSRDTTADRTPSSRCPHPLPAVDMLSDMSFPFDMHTSLDHLQELAPLNFDDLLDIAREFEFTRTITHIWPCEEEPSTHPEMELEDILAAIVPTPATEETSLSLSSSALPVTLDRTHVQQTRESAPMCPVSDASASIPDGPTLLSKDDNQVQVKAEPSSALILRGWSPPNRSQFLDLDDSLMLPQAPRDIWTPPWLATCLPPPISTTDKTTGDSPKSAAFLPKPVQPSTRAILEPVRVQSVLRINSDVPNQTTIIPRTNSSRPRLYLPFPTAGGVSTARYAKAPRGGIPPHVARTVAKASILLAEEERKVMRDAFSDAATGERKKPSVLRKAARVGGETNKAADGVGAVNKLSARGGNDHKTGRPAKRVKV